MALANSASAALVDLRIVERTGQAVATPSDNTLDFAVQVRVNSPTLAIGANGFDIRFFGEAESWGQLSRGRITSTADFTYTSEIGGPAANFHSGLPGHMRYFANINSGFNGSINVTGGPFTNTPDQEIGIVGGIARQDTLLSIPGVDADGDSIPDVVGAGETRGQLPSAILNEYFAQENWIDIYRFRYRVTSFADRVLDVRIPVNNSFAVNLFTGEVYQTNGVWVYSLISTSDISIQNWTGAVVPATPTAALLVCGGALALRRRTRS